MTEIVWSTALWGKAAGGEVVGEAEGVAGLVRGELADALEDHCEHGVRFGVIADCRGGPIPGLRSETWGTRLSVRREKSFCDEVVLPAAEAAEGYVALDDLAGARVGDGGAVAPAAGVAVDPLDDVVANVHGVGAGGERCRRGRCLWPSRRPGTPVSHQRAPSSKRGADGLGRAAIDVILDGSLGFAGLGAGGVFFDEAVADR